MKSVRGTFCGILQDCGIDAQYTMHGTLVTERRNRALMDMVRSMMSTWHLLESLSGQALKIVAYILNRVLSNSLPNHFWVMDC